jgi:hypothetical protein
MSKPILCVDFDGVVTRPKELLNFKPWNKREASSGGLTGGKITGDPGAIRRNERQ